jgi:hypothetical protein
MTVLVYVNTSKQVGDPEHLKVVANADAQKNGLRKTIPRAWPLSMRFSPSARFARAGAACPSTSSSCRSRVDFSHIARGQRH